ncbi:MAG: hypothetical protein WAN51_01705 [Alphaproteobacteria bacterium]
MTGKSVTPLIDLPDESSFGEAMLALSPGRRAFVYGKVMLGLKNAEAARLAGYSDKTEHAIEVKGWQLAHSADVQAAILEVGRQLMRTEGPRSIKVLCEIRDDAKVKAGDRIKAASTLLDRAGFNAVSEHTLHVEHSLSENEKDRRILSLCAELGIAETEAKKFLIAPANFTDADYEIVGEPTPAQPMTEEEQRAAAQRERDNELRRQRRNMTPEELAEHKERTRAERSEKSKEKYAAHREPVDDLDKELADLLASIDAPPAEPEEDGVTDDE